MEQETDNKLPFLDVLLMKDDNNRKIKTTVYRKKTHRQVPLLHITPPGPSKEKYCKTLLKRARDFRSAPTEEGTGTPAGSDVK